jgi:lincosamide nucleotidyltransferase A/C/D/E
MCMTMTATDVVEILGWLSTANVDVWLDGGWGVDALVGEQTREHKDLDLIVRDAHEPRMREALATHGFIQVRGVPQNFVLADERGREVDVHPVRFDDQGNGHLLSEDGEPFGHSMEAFAATGGRFRISRRVSVRRSAGFEPFVGIRAGRHGCPRYEASSRPPGNAIDGAVPIGLNLAGPFGVAKTRSFRRAPDRLRGGSGAPGGARRDAAGGRSLTRGASDWSTSGASDIALRGPPPPPLD